MPISSSSGGHLVSKEVRGSGGIPSQRPKRTLMEGWCFCGLKLSPFCCYCCRCTSALSWSVGKHKISLSPQMTQPQTLQSMCLKTGLQVMFFLTLMSENNLKNNSVFIVSITYFVHTGTNAIFLTISYNSLYHCSSGTEVYIHNVCCAFIQLAIFQKLYYGI